MIRKKLLFVGAGLSALCLGGAGFCLSHLSSPVSVSAGSSKRYALSSNSVVDGHINTGDLRVSGDVEGKGSSLVFGQGKAIAKMRINNYKNAGIERLYQADFALDFQSMEEGGVFRICSGLSGLSSTYQDKGSLSFSVQKQYGVLFLSVEESYGDGMKTTLFAKKEVTSLKEGQKVSFSIEVLTKGELSLSIGSSSLLKGAKLLESGAGYFGFFSEGNNNVILSGANVYGYTYNAPENVPSYLETFDQQPGAYNANYFYSAGSSSPVNPSYLSVEKDVGALHFCNVSASHLTTRYMYSNFEVEFNIPQMRKEAVFDETGALLSPITTGFGIAWGVEDPMTSAGQTWTNSTWLHFENIAIDPSVDHTKANPTPMVKLYSSRNCLKYGILKRNFFSPSETRVPTIKLSLVNGDLNAYLRYEGEESYGDPIFSYDLGETAEGYLRIMTLGDSALAPRGLAYTSVSNFSIDDLRIENLDSPNYRQETEVDFRPNGMSDAEDFNYTTKTDDGDLIGNRLSGKKDAGNNAFAGGIFSLIGSILLGGAFFALAFAKRS